MSLHQIEYFVAIAEEGSLRGAAERLHVSQPPLTRHLRALEDELGTPLFERTSKGVTLLPEGEVFLRHARRVLSSIDAAVEAVRDLKTSAD
ncbi:MAG: LysR family transcriptional regulator [Bradymonadia bacterium]